MSQSDPPPPGPDLSFGMPLASVPMDGVLAGHVDGEAVLLSRLDDGILLAAASVGRDRENLAIEAGLQRRPMPA